MLIYILSVAFLYGNIFIVPLLGRLMKLGSLLGIIALAYSCAAATPEHSRPSLEHMERALPEMQAALYDIKTADAASCQKYTRLYKQISAFLEESCPTVIPVELEEFCQDFKQVKAETKRIMVEDCY